MIRPEELTRDLTVKDRDGYGIRDGFVEHEFLTMRAHGDASSVFCRFLYLRGPLAGVHAQNRDDMFDEGEEMSWCKLHPGGSNP